MSSIDEIRDTRIKKLELLKSKGVNPYPAESSRELALHEATLNFDTLEKNGLPDVLCLYADKALLFL